ncbi:hypothetical protein AB833_31915 [Chromatiales bacterium (ex Bugula neritina AB1)]|nr:hypothetical protein AB833_31915 [Chromatiales bacterium (ex Bugula neritina AB1)]
MGHMNTEFVKPEVALAMSGNGGRALQQTTAVNCARGLAYWSRDGGGDIHYVRPAHHTLSVYLQGGHGVSEIGRPQINGSPGAICVLPAGHESHWHNSAHVGVLHVYFDDSHLQTLGVRSAGELRQVHFGRDSLLQTLANGLITEVNWSGIADSMVLEHLVSSMLVRLLARPVCEQPGRGLSQQQLLSVENRLQACVDEQCSLVDLAADTGLSVRQFSRAYRLATGTTAGQRMLEIQIERVKVMIRQGISLAEIAHAAGFSSQSHMSRRFRQQTGLTPGTWRREGY